MKHNNSLYQCIRSDSTTTQLTYGKREKQSFKEIKKVVNLTNARESSPSLTLDENGFALIQHDIVFDEHARQKALYDYGELLGEQLKRLIKANNHLLLGAITRNEKKPTAENGSTSNRAAAHLIHSDWGEARIQQFGIEEDRSLPLIQGLTLEKIREFIESAHDWSIYNIWVPIKTVVNNPLALCDKKSISLNDVIADVMVHRHGKTTGMNLLKFNKNHRWYYFPLMQSNEALVFHQYHSKHSDSAFMPTFHTAFNLINDPSINMHTRESVDFRFLVRH